ncbi:MAG: helix-turn-helix transcriptional regulator [bacterium]|nr:helix-turn-helix transcriptional regulator [bacterium]
METPLDGFGQRVREQRKSLGLSMAELGRMMGQKSSWMVWAWESGERRDPSASSIIALAEALRCSTSYLLEGKHAPYRVPKKEDT